MACGILMTSASFFILRVSKHETSGQTSEESTSHRVSFRTGNPDDIIIAKRDRDKARVF